LKHQSFSLLIAATGTSASIALIHNGRPDPGNSYVLTNMPHDSSDNISVKAQSSPKLT